MAPEEKSIVFYSEGPAYWVHLQPIVKCLVEDHGKQLCYLSSHSNDPGLHTGLTNIKPFCIGEGALRTAFFKSLAAKVMVMTMTDLEDLLQEKWLRITSSLVIKTPYYLPMEITTPFRFGICKKWKDFAQILRLLI